MTKEKEKRPIDDLQKRDTNSTSNKICECLQTKFDYC